jgi:hypothetical protein
MPRLVHIGLRPAAPRVLLSHDDDDQGAAAPEADTTRDDLPETTLDEQEHVGILPNWEPNYDYAEQVRRFDSTTPENRAMGYAQMPASAASALFHRKWIEWAKDRSLTLDTIDLRMFPGGRVIIGVDPAFASGPRASWFVALPVLFVPATNTTPERRIVVAMEHQRGLASVEEQGAVLQRLHRDWRAEWLAIECNAAQTYLASYCDNTLHLPVKRIVTAEHNAEDLPALASEFAAHRWVIPWGDAITQRVLAPLVNEATEYPMGTKDCLMAMSFAVRIHYETPARKTGAGMHVGAVYA